MVGCYNFDCIFEHVIDIIYLRLGLPHFHVYTFGIVTGILCLLCTAFFIRNTDQLRSPDEEEADEDEEASDEMPELDPRTGEPKAANSWISDPRVSA